MAVVEYFEFSGREGARDAGSVHEEQVPYVLQGLNVSLHQFEGSVNVRQKVADADQPMSLS
jgi:hypothetical protein